MAESCPEEYERRRHYWIGFIHGLVAGAIIVILLVAFRGVTTGE